jgi:hypothetical protein
MKYAAHFLALTLTLASLTAAAQLPSNQTLVARVPFQFTVGNSVVPAGEWMTKSASPGSLALTINNQHAKVSLVAMARSDEGKQTAASCALVFHRYGETYFLTGIKIGGSRDTYKLPESSRERELQIAGVPATEQSLLASLK